jgi:Leucine-rich repeat (LRR) protein
MCLWSYHEHVCLIKNTDSLFRNLAQKGLIGQIPSALEDLSFLRHLYLYDNLLNGTIPSSLGGLSSLDHLYLNNNELTGEIPSSLGYLFSLTYLQLRGNLLGGTIPSSLRGLSSLIILTLGDNALTSEIPQWLGDLSSLNQLDLSRNHLNGTIPSSLGSLSLLFQLDLSSNQIDGTIPQSFESLSSLRYLSLGKTQLDGTVLSFLGSLSFLQHLYLDHNQFIGEIPPSLGSLSSLVTLSLHNNKLSGVIPKSLGLLPKLSDFFLSNNSLAGLVPELPSSINICELSNNTGLCANPAINHICNDGLVKCNMDFRMMNAWLPKMFDDSTCCFQSGIGCINDRITNLYVCFKSYYIRTLGSLGVDGQIPESIGDLNQLTRLDLNSNNFTGEIPISIELLSRLEYLNLENNLLSGSISSSLGYLNPLRYIYLNNNKLSGEIPESLGYLDSLYHLDLKHNQLSGSIPSTFGDRSTGASSLRILSLENNELNGTIPVSFGDLRYISYLGLGNNQFSGEIPSSFGDISTLKYLSLNINQLSGQIPLSLVNLVLLKELYLANNVLLTGLIPSLPGLIVLDISGTNLNYALEGSTTSLGSIKTERAEQTKIPDVNATGAVQPIAIIAFVSSTGAIYLAVVTGIIILIVWRGAKNKREKRDNQAQINEARSNLYEMSVMAGDTVQSGSELVFISMISSGAFGEVWKGIHRGEIVAIKMMKLDRMPNDQLKFIQEVLTEAKIMRDMKNDRVVQFISFDFRKVSIIMELMPQGALSSLIAKSKHTMKWSTRYQMMLDICEGMAYLHSATHADGSEKKEIYHQDLKSANVLLIEVDGIIRAKIGDFGLSRMILII